MVATSSNTFAGAIGSKSVNVIGSIKNTATELYSNGLQYAKDTIVNTTNAINASDAVPANGGSGAAPAAQPQS